MSDTYLRVTMLNRDYQKSLDTLSQDAQVSRATENYLEKIRDIKSIDDFLDDYEVYSYAMKAFGLEDMTYAKAYMRKVLEEGVSSSDSFANQLTDTRFKEFAEAFDFENLGEATTAMSRTQDEVVDKYLEQTLESREGEENVGVQLALYFQNKASSITNPLELLGDEALAEVARTIAGIPDEAAGADIDWLAEAIGDKIDVEKLSDPDYVDELVERFSILYDLNNDTTSTEVPNVLISSSSVIGLDEDLLMSLQGLHLGGI
ncbi:DUF1217 domain-containing protein [uncultured Cohaesibacter sp.]|uniref:DUF1217 domain-containing protein n=1 Tax=uncultured Cohaesibacter sp. TaxID=1002546 RepID=UPI0029C843D6|nr:DUF1217 domain-containing protein [uncultured Cohaesibacter sp.]